MPRLSAEDKQKLHEERLKRKEERLLMEEEDRMQKILRWEEKDAKIPPQYDLICDFLKVLGNRLFQLSMLKRELSRTVDEEKYLNGKKECDRRYRQELYSICINYLSSDKYSKLGRSDRVSDLVIKLLALEVLIHEEINKPTRKEYNYFITHGINDNRLITGIILSERFKEQLAKTLPGYADFDPDYSEEPQVEAMLDRMALYMDSYVMHLIQSASTVAAIEENKKIKPAPKLVQPKTTLFHNKYTTTPYKPKLNTIEEAIEKAEIDDLNGSEEAILEQNLLRREKELVKLCNEEDVKTLNLK